MWFKNLQVYRLIKPVDITQESLEAALLKQPIRACSKLERQTSGWISPLGTGHHDLVHAANGCLMITFAKREKILPTSVIREHAEEQIFAQETEESRALSRRERRSIMDEVALQLLPQALSRTTTTYAYIDPENGLLLVDTASQKRADEIIILLRDCLGRLPMVLPQLETSISYTMTQWILSDNCPAGFTIDDYCELQQPNKERAVIRCLHREVSTESIRAHIHENMQVVQLGMTWNDRISYVLDHNFAIKRIKFLELAEDSFNQPEEIDSPELQFDADFAIFAAEFAHFIPALATALGGFSDILSLESESFKEKYT